MLHPQTRSEPQPSPELPADLEDAYQRCLTFPISSASDARLSPAEMQPWALEEAAFGRVIIDKRALPSGMRTRVLRPAAEVLRRWRQVRAPFDVLLVPHKRELDALDRLDGEIAELESRCESEIAKRNETLAADTEYAQIEQRFKIAERRFNEKFEENNQRVAITWGARWSYILAIGCTGILEWMINYDTFYLFLQIPAMAAGATLILGVLLTFTAHYHGELFRQWSYRFGLHRSPGERASDRRIFAFATFGLLLVVGTAGGARYLAALRSIMAHTGYNPIPGAEQAAYNPTRDVLLSLLLNIIAWAVGVFIAYRAHDPDPDFMEAAVDFKKKERVYTVRRVAADRDIESIRARFAKQIGQKRTAAAAQARNVQQERNLLNGVREHESIIIRALVTALAESFDEYRSLLVKALIAKQGDLRIEGPDGQTLSLHEWKAMPLGIDPGLVGGL